MYYPARNQWTAIWGGAILAIAVAGWDKWPALVQSPERRQTELQKRWEAQQIAKREAPTAFEVLLAVTDSGARADADVRHARIVASLGGLALAALGVWQVAGRRARTERQDTQ